MPALGAFTIDPQDVVIVYGVARIEGYADGSFVEVEYNADMWALVMGADGLGARVKSNDLSARITIRLMPNAPSNLVLAAAQAADQIANRGALPLVITFTNTTPPTSFGCDGAWVVKDPGISFSKDSVDPVEWVLETNRLIPVHGADV